MEREGKKGRMDHGPPRPPEISPGRLLLLLLLLLMPLRLQRQKRTQKQRRAAEADISVWMVFADPVPEWLPCCASGPLRWEGNP